MQRLYIMLHRYGVGCPGPLQIRIVLVKLLNYYHSSANNNELTYTPRN